MASITLENLNKTYPNGFVSVKNLSLHIEDGEFVTFFGPSGCGKSMPPLAFRGSTISTPCATTS